MAQHTILAPAAAALLAALVAAGCGSPVGGAGPGSTVVAGGETSSADGASSTIPTSTATVGPTSGETSTSDAQTSTRRTTSDPDPGQTAQGSPIDVPTIPDSHISMDGLRENITALFERACGVGPGEPLCVTLVFTDGACFVGYDPPTTARRHSTVTVVTESQEKCDAANQPTDTTTTTASTPTTNGDATATESATSASGQGPSQNQSQDQSPAPAGDVPADAAPAGP